MNIKVLLLAQDIESAEQLAEFGRPFDERTRIDLLGNGLASAAHWAKSCMCWVWRQWLSGSSKEEIAKKVRPLVDRGIELRERSGSYHGLPLHDLFLLNCAIFGGSEAQLKMVAERVADASGDKDEKPLDFGYGELYTAAWSGMLKYWILGDQAKAMQQSELIWGAYRDKSVFAGPKPLVMPWLKRDWKAFVKAQEKDFQNMWKKARKDLWTVREENAMQITVTTHKYQIGHQWCWGHCGLALLAHREGVTVATDPFWFPRAAIEDAEKPTATIKDSEQLDML